MPKSFILVPGYGAQGGQGKDLVHFFNEDGLGAIVNSSHGIICAYKQDKYKEQGMTPENFADASRLAVKDMIADISGALAQMIPREEFTIAPNPSSLKKCTRSLPCPPCAP